MRKLIIGLALPLLLVGCGSDDSGSATVTSVPTDTDAPSTTAVTPVAAFPVTVTGKLGDVTIESQPERVLPLTGADLDTVLSLGITPIAVPTDDAGQQIEYPWLADLLPADAPVLDVNAAASLPVEKIAALDPDVIIANGYWDLETYYDQLSQIAPVVHYLNGQNADGWEATTTTIAAALGASDRAAVLVAETDDVIAAAAAAHPDFAGKVFDLVIARDAATIGILRSEADAMGRNVAVLGLTLSDFARSLPGDDLKVSLSAEQVPELQPDVLFVVGPDGIEQVLAADPVWSSLDVMQRGSTVFLTRGSPTALALGFPTAINLQWLTGQITPLIETALAAA